MRPTCGCCSILAARRNRPFNEIVSPAGIRTPPLFGADADDAANYGAIGAVIGHEMTHGLDNAGREYDARGNLRAWWTPANTTAFDARAQCTTTDKMVRARSCQIW